MADNLKINSIPTKRFCGTFTSNNRKDLNERQQGGKTVQKQIPFVHFEIFITFKN